MISRNNPHLLLTLVLAMLMIGTAISVLPISVYGENKPDLTLDSSDIRFSDSEPEEGDNITIYATIYNDGDANASDVLVSFKDHSHGDGKVIVIENRTIRTLEAGSMINLSVEWTAEPAGNHTIKVLIDPDDTIMESNESNNNAGKKIVVQKGGSGDSTEIFGYVYEKESRGTPIENANITMVGKTTNDTYTVYTNRDGYYEKKISQEDNYTITAMKDGYINETQHRYVAKGTSEQVNFHLEKEHAQGDTILKGYTKEQSNSTHIPQVSVNITKGNYTNSTTSDGNGYYEFLLEEGGTYAVHARKAGYKDYDVNVSVKEGDTTTHHIYLENESGSEKTKIYGYVKEDESRKPINGSKVTIVHKGNNESAIAYTNGDGYYVKELSTGGNYTVTAEKDGYLSSTKDAYIRDGEHKRLDFYLEKESSSDETVVYGYVRDNATRGEGIANAELKFTNEDCNCSFTTYSDENGYYQRDLPTGGGNHTILVNKSGYETITTRKYIEHEEHNRIDFQLDRKQDNDTKFYGYVRDKTTDEGIDNAKVILKIDNTTINIWSESNGYYEKYLNEVGNYSITVEKSGYDSQTKFEAIQEGEYKKVNFYLVRESSSNNTILKGYTKEKSNGTHIPNVDILLKKGDHEWSLSSDREGYFEIELDEGGNYTILVNHDDYKEYEHHIHVYTNDENVHHIKLERNETGDNETWIYGYITEDSRGNQIKNATITITSNECNCTYQTYSHVNGHNQQQVEVGGNYSVEVKKDGYVTQEKFITIIEEEENRLDFVLKREEQEETWIRGFVFDNITGDPIADADVTLTVIECGCPYHTITNSSGFYAISVTKYGDSYIVAKMDGYYDTQIFFTVVEGTETTLDIPMEKVENKTILKGYVNEQSRGGAIPDVEITITRGDFTETTYSDTGGYYEFTLEEGGEYHLEARKSGYETYQVNVTVEKGTETTFNFHLERSSPEAPRVKGYVVNKDTLAPLPQATVTITGKECNCSYSGTTLENGYYLIELGPAGNYTITATKVGYSMGSKEFYVSEGVDAVINFHLEEQATIISGHVWEGQTRGNTISDATVRIISNNESHIIHTNEQGYYEQKLNGAGNFTITASKDGYFSSTQTVSIITGENKVVDFHLYPDETQSVNDTLFLRENNKLSPFLPTKNVAHKLDVEADYDEHPLMRTNRQYVDVGTWIYDPMIQQTVLSGTVTFNAWFMVEPDSAYNADPDWMFILYQNGVEITSAEILNTEESDTEPVDVEATTTLNDPVVLEAGDELSVNIQYRGWEDIDFYYGNVTYDAGVTVNANPGFADKPAMDQYGVSIEANKRTVDLQNTNQTEITIVITNTGLEEDSYSLTATGSYQGYKVTFDSPDTIILSPGSTHTFTITLSEEISESPDEDTIVVNIVVRSDTYSEVYDSVRIEGTVKDSGFEIPDLTIPLIAVSLGAGALVASFRRRY